MLKKIHPITSPLFLRQYAPLPKLEIKVWSWVLWPSLHSLWHAAERTFTLWWPSVLLEMPFVIACASFHLLLIAVPLIGFRYVVVCVCNFEILRVCEPEMKVNYKDEDISTVFLGFGIFVSKEKIGFILLVQYLVCYMINPICDWNHRIVSATPVFFFSGHLWKISFSTEDLECMC